MSFAVDLPLLIDFVAACGDDFGLERQVAARNADAIELQLEISLAPEVAWILGCFEMADEIATARKSLLTMPITAWQAIVGKFLASWLFLGLALVLTFPVVLTVNYLGTAHDWTPPA